MKKLFLAVLMAVLVAPFMSFAETTESVMAEMDAIKVKRAAIQQELIELNRQERDLRLKLSGLKYANTAETEVASPAEEIVAETVVASLGAPVITSPLDGMIVPLTETMVKVEGTAPAGAQKIIVNGYALTKFVPGNTTWVYYATPRFATMKEGPNFYTAVAVDNMGNKTVSNEMALYYGEPPADEIMVEGEEMPIEREMGELRPVRSYPYRSRVTNPAWESSDFSTLDRESFSGNLERVQEQQKRANEKLMRYRNL